MSAGPVTVEALREAVRDGAPAEAAEWLDGVCARGAAQEVRRAFASAARRVGAGRAALDGPPPEGPRSWSVADAARVLLIASLGAAAEREAGDLYRFGSSDERRAVLRALDVLPLGRTGVALVRDALRTNDTDLIAAALGDFGLSVLDEGEAAQAILKCVFVGIPLGDLPDPGRRAGPELARMLAEYALERVVAGRDVPADVWPLIEAHPPREALDALALEARSPVAERRRAARVALAARTDAARRSP
ncbi:MAG: EboA domain-containing protein [Thermoleophilia bacterium]